MEVLTKYSLYIVDLRIEYVVKSKVASLVQTTQMNLLPLVLDENNLREIHPKTMKSITKYLSKMKRIDQSTISVKNVLVLKAVFSSKLKYDYNEKF